MPHGRFPGRQALAGPGVGELADGFEAQRMVADWMRFHNHVRPHSSLGVERPPRRMGARCRRLRHDWPRDFHRSLVSHASSHEAAPTSSGPCPAMSSLTKPCTRSHASRRLRLRASRSFSSGVRLAARRVHPFAVPSPLLIGLGRTLSRPLPHPLAGLRPVPARVHRPSPSEHTPPGRVIARTLARNEGACGCRLHAPVNDTGMDAFRAEMQRLARPTVTAGGS